MAERLLSPDLLPPRTPTIEVRLRFYDVAFRGTARPDVRAPGAGRFREAVIALPAVANGVDGQVSAFMWSDNIVYQMWAREAFGWPVHLGTIGMSELADLSRTGDHAIEASLVAPDGEARLQVNGLRVADPAEARSDVAWLTPRRVMQRAGLDADERQVLVVRPTPVKRGVHYLGAGDVFLTFPADHVLHDASQVHHASIDADLDFEIVVGDRVDVA
ncbi:MAG: hypothetical protein ACYDCI_00470 [Candidatus Limnocylindrales bacterium]